MREPLIAGTRLTLESTACPADLIAAQRSMADPGEVAAGECPRGATPGPSPARPHRGQPSH
jgi:hypothetical protein